MNGNAKNFDDRWRGIGLRGEASAADERALQTTRSAETAERCLAAQADGPSGTAVRLTAADLVPAHLLDGGEIVHFAIKPAPWFILFSSIRWLATAIGLSVLAGTTDVISPGYHIIVLQASVVIALVGLGWATLEWVSRLYVLTNRRAMSIRGVMKVEMFECQLQRIQHIHLSASPPERALRVGNVFFRVASGAGGTGAWRTVSRPQQVHQKLREAVVRAQNRGGNGL